MNSDQTLTSQLLAVGCCDLLGLFYYKAIPVTAPESYNGHDREDIQQLSTLSLI
ncbi:hypothetical protein [Oceaniferula marina]|uniref:hypothetical protein n=1 Tax=Oceaniferula marina TaxID=2748318 RepID=UPI001D047D4F|nr:hypothetical protein [Oceaniferula marina]